MRQFLSLVVAIAGLTFASEDSVCLAANAVIIFVEEEVDKTPHINSFYVWYELRLSSPEEDLCAGFPIAAFGGELTECEPVSLQGAILDFSSPILWDLVNPLHVVGDLPLITPESVTLGNIATCMIRFVDPDLQRSALEYYSDSVQFWPSQNSVVATPWSVTVCFEARGTYESAGIKSGELLMSELGLEPWCAELQMTGLPVLATSPSSWGRLKALF